ncbi:aromatic acid exporter family protein [Actinomadura atramentaria]|uniref:aromatic acid exporter family protein n=1 Tax=Actinomadura atramentaria TaxID=1990 RepID=UPI000365E9A4|nr:aromatic acid exporter family protein [Actinomadura atramentaria]
MTRIRLLSRLPAGTASQLKFVGTRVARLTLTSIAAYVLADWLLKGPAPLLAPLTALLVVQYSIYETIKSSIGRVLAVTSGVLLAVLFGHTVGFSWWSLGLTIFAALVIGFALRLGDHLLEVPISAMLIYALGASNTAGATDRVVETLIGAGTGLVVTVLVPAVQVTPAQEAVENLANRMSKLIDDLAEAVRRGVQTDDARQWRSTTDRLFQDIGQTDQALEAAEQSVRLNPRASRIIDAGAALRNGVETLERFAVSLRGLARAVTDAAHLDDRNRILDEVDVREPLARTLTAIRDTVVTYATLARSDVERSATPSDLEEQLSEAIATAQEQRDLFVERLLGRLEADLRWPLYGEILMHLDRLIDDLRVEHRMEARELWRQERGASRLLPERPARAVSRASGILRGATRSAGDSAERNASAADVGSVPNRPRETAHSHHPPQR